MSDIQQTLAQLRGRCSRLEALNEGYAAIHVELYEAAAANFIRHVDAGRELVSPDDGNPTGIHDDVADLSVSDIENFSCVHIGHSRIFDLVDVTTIEGDVCGRRRTNRCLALLRSTG